MIWFTESKTERLAEKDRGFQLEEKKKFQINWHLIFGVLLALILITCVVRLVQWNMRTKNVDLSDINDGDYDMECMDFYVYPDAEALANHEDNGVNDILVIGDYIVNNYGKKDSILNYMKDNMEGANIIDLTCEKQMLSCGYNEPGAGPWCFSLHNIIIALTEHNFTFQVGTYPTEPFDTKERYEAYMDTLLNLDLNDVDTVLIMYSMHDYYGGVPEIFLDEHNCYGYHGAILSAIELLQEKYPHLQIILSSPVPEYMTNDDGTLALGSQTNYGQGKETIYIDHQYAVATQCCISYIDNYFYGINESNITDYVDGYNLNKDGIKLIGEHIVEFIRNRGSEVAK